MVCPPKKNLVVVERWLLVNTRLYLCYNNNNKKSLTKLLDLWAGAALSLSSATEHAGVASVQFSLFSLNILTNASLQTLIDVYRKMLVQN